MKPRPARTLRSAAVRHPDSLARHRRWAWLRRRERRDDCAARQACRRRRPCRSAGRCRRSRGPSASSARSRAGPRAGAPAEREARADDLEVGALGLRDAVDEDLERPRDARRQLDSRPGLHRLYDAMQRAPESPRTRRSRARGRCTIAGAALAGNGGLAPRGAALARTRSASGRRYFFVLVFAAIVFVGVEGALLALIVTLPARQAAAVRRRACRSTARPGSRCSGRSCRC